MGKLINIKFSVNAQVENLVKLQDLNFYKYYKKAEQEKNKIVGVDDVTVSGRVGTLSSKYLLGS